MNENIKIIEINGVKLEIDLREAKVIDNFRIGDSVKVLTKEYSSYSSHPGVIVGFDQFEKLPTIIIAYVETSYTETKIKLVYINDETKDVEICKAHNTELSLDKNAIIKAFDNDIAKNEEAIRDIKEKKRYFLNNFNKYFVKGE